MKTRFGCRSIGRWACTMALLFFCSGTTVLATGCDTEVSTAVLGGLQDLSYTLVDAVFLSIETQLENNATGTTTTTTTTDTADTTDTTSSSS